MSSSGPKRREPRQKIVAMQILLLGAPLDTITLLHHSEHVVQLANKRIKRYKRHIRNERGVVETVDIEEFDTSDPVVEGMPEDHVRFIAERALEEGAGRSGTVGNAAAYLFEAAPLHTIGVGWLEDW